MAKTYVVVVGVLIILTSFAAVAAPVEHSAVVREVERDAGWREAFAARVDAAWRNGDPMPQLSACYPGATLADGYAVQQEFVARTMGVDGVGGFKAAVVGKEGQARLGIDGPVSGIVPASGILHAADSVVIDLAKDHNRYIESEIGYVFGRAIEKPLKDVEALKGYVKAVVPVIELPGGATENAQPSTAADLAAWNSNAKQMIVGPEHDPEGVAVDDITVSLEHNGKSINTAAGRDAAGGQWATLLKTVNNLASRGYTLKPGQVLTNGALGKIVKAEPGQYRAQYKELGTITFEVRDSGISQ